MRRLREWLLRLAGTVRPRRSDADMQEELRCHLELAEEEAARRGEPARNARLRAGGTAIRAARVDPAETLRCD